MRHLDNRRKRFAWLLMLVYVPMLLAITFHHHSAEEGQTTYCYECAHHIHHDGHLTAQHSFMHECVLCQLHSLPYVVPTLVTIAVFVAIVHLAFSEACPFVKSREGSILSTRAPPAILFL